MPRAVILIHAFDAHAGAQRVAARLAAVLRAAPGGCWLWLGFGTRGFVSEAGPDWRFLPVDRPRWRKLLWPLWLIAANLACLGPLLSGQRVWANSIAALPAAAPFLLFAPHRTIIHIHENRIPSPLRWLIAWAGQRGATVLAVSAHHARMLGLPVTILPNAVGAGEPPGPPPVRDRLTFVGTASAMKGFPLFLEVVRRLNAPELAPHAFLADGIDAPSPTAIDAAKALSIAVSIGVSDPALHHDRSFLMLQLTDPALADETFSLVAAEAIWHLVPVGGAGAAVLPEVAGEALAFNIASRDPQDIADAIAALWADPAHHARLVEAAAAIRPRHGIDRFAEQVAAIASATHG